MRQLISVKDISIAKTSCWIYVRYIAEVFKTRSNLAAKFKVQLLPLSMSNIADDVLCLALIDNLEVALACSFHFFGKHAYTK